ncbi:MAG TPA: YIP1 family protein [Longimicrobiales bacterium]|nr:YIP1 family protein [Longimicrobiales bacterium]
MTVDGYAGPRRPFIGRMIAAATFDISVYEEVEADSKATGQAAAVVAIAAVAAAIGGMKGNFVGALLGSLVGWALWAGVTYFIGVTLFKGKATWGELLRTLGFAQSPAVFYVLAFVPLVGWIVRGIVAVWLLITGFIAIRQALDVSNMKAFATAVIGWICLCVITVIFGGLFFLR